MRVLHVDNLMVRRYGARRSTTGRKLFNGMVRSNWKVLEFSERDVARFEAPLQIRPLGIPAANKKLIETADNFRPELIILGHCDLITNETLRKIRTILPGVKIAYRNIDPLWEERNIERIKYRMKTTDAIFVTTGGEPLKQFLTGGNAVAYIPNATDPAEDDQNNALKTEFERDLVFCGAGNKTDDRYPFVKKLHETLDSKLRFDSFGMHGHPFVTGYTYDQVLATSKMGLNFNRFEGWPLYSSDRIAQMMGNGLLTFLWDQGNMRKFFTDEHVVFFKNFDDLTAKISAFHADDAHRQNIAKSGHDFYHEHFSGQRIVQFMNEVTLNLPYSHDYIWQDEVYR